ncbi:hypothetical protein BPOR_0183g00030 [Botrytis porri]|uniref:Uncharacterized protein n=1 Tax=Botrytis porri TaxID=87229 RepID=A0A4Z1KU98_9HELO|nr:hypothetical protein BPOR_0183g00030 [Botrytis porri]
MHFKTLTPQVFSVITFLDATERINPYVFEPKISGYLNRISFEHSSEAKSRMNGLLRRDTAAGLSKIDEFSAAQVVHVRKND